VGGKTKKKKQDGRYPVVTIRPKTVKKKKPKHSLKRAELIQDLERVKRLLVGTLLDNLGGLAREFVGKKKNRENLVDEMNDITKNKQSQESEEIKSPIDQTNHRGGFVWGGAKSRQRETMKKDP